jgi:hypothetical protein
MMLGESDCEHRSIIALGDLPEREKPGEAISIFRESLYDAQGSAEGDAK